MGAEEGVAEEEMREALALEIEIAKASTSRENRRDPNSMYNPTTVGAMKSLPGFPPSFKEYFSRFFKACSSVEVELGNDEKIIVADPQYLTKVSAILEGADN